MLHMSKWLKNKSNVKKKPLTMSGEGDQTGG